MKKGYFANGLFSAADMLLNKEIEKKLNSVIDLGKLKMYFPHNNDEINDKTKVADSLAIMNADRNELMSSDFLIAVIDGVEIDAGVAAEIGLFASTGKPIYALYSDVRLQGNENVLKLDAIERDATENQFMYRNLFVIGLIKENGMILQDVETLVDTVLKKEVL